MGIFDKFKKKKENKSEIAVKEKPVSGDLNTQNGKSNSGPDFLLMNAENHIGKNSSAYKLWELYQTESGKSDEYLPLEYIEPVISAALSEEAVENDHIESELIRFLREIQKHCDSIAAKLKKESAQKNSSASAINAEPMLFLTKNKLRLWIAIMPPLNGGEHITADTLKFRMDSLSVKYGIDSDMTQKVVSDKMYMKVIQLAVGKAAVHGKNGTCKELFSKFSNRVNIKEDNHGNVNYKELNMIQSIHKGETICEITLPTDASDGITVTGETIVGRIGKYPNVPAGKNTEFTDDKTRLVAKIDGEVIFDDNKFNVRNLLTIDSDVDNAVGNIDFSGDVLIRGDVREGYTVRAEGDVHITGTVEGAVVIVGGDLTIDRGMNGGNKGYIEVQGILKCRYLENCKVYAKEGIEVDQIMYASLSTDKDISVKGKKGSVTGGRLVVGGKIDAVTIGTLSNSTLKTEIVLGSIPHLIETKKDLEVQLKASQNNLLKMTQDITYIKSNIESASDERKGLLKSLLGQYQIDRMKNQKLEAELESVNEKIQANTENCGLRCNKVFPIISLNVCGTNYVINDEIRDCKITRKNNKTYIMGSNLDSMIIF